MSRLVSRLKSFALILFISPEVIFVLVIFVFLIYEPNQAKIIGHSIRSDAEVWKYLPLLTLAFSGAAIKSSFKLRAPLENSSNKTLYEWPLYPLLVDRVYVCLFFGISSSAASLFLWFLGHQLDDITIAATFLISTFVSGTTALTMILAQQKLRELLEKYTQ